MSPCLQRGFSWHSSAIMQANRVTCHFELPIPDLNRFGLLVRIYPNPIPTSPIPLELPTINIGRDQANHIVISDDSVSRCHAVIMREEDGHTIQDTVSTNGTYINDAKVDKVKLCAGDRIRLGNHIFRYLHPQDIEAQYVETIFQSMTTDALTSTYNNRYLVDCLDNEIAASIHSGQTFCVMMIEMNNFGTLVNHYGPIIGDAFLTEFARRAKAQLDVSDLIARFDENRFCVVYRPSHLEQAIAMSERVRGATCKRDYVWGDLELTITASVGVSEFDGRNPIDTDQLVQEALLNQSFHYIKLYLLVDS